MPRCQHLTTSLLLGPDLINGLIGILCRFRQERVAVVCDIRKMFYQFRVNEEHRNFLRFLWYKDDKVDFDPIEYRMKVHLFGAVSSPGCANFALQRAAEDGEQEFGTANSRLYQTGLLCRRRLNLGTNYRRSCGSDNEHQGTLCEEKYWSPPIRVEQQGGAESYCGRRASRLCARY